MIPLFNPDSYVDENGQWHPATPPNPNIWVQPEDPTGDSRFHVPTPTPENPNNWGLQQNPLLRQILFLDHTSDPAGAHYAQNLEEEGLSREEIWDRTNWWRDPVGRWLKDVRADGIRQTKELPMHPDMFLNYFEVPEHLRNLVREEGPDALDFFDTLRVRNIAADPDRGPFTLGSYDPINHMINISDLDPENTQHMETLYHELQHAIQNKRGDHPENFSNALANHMEYLRNVQEANARVAGRRDTYPEKYYGQNRPPWESYIVNEKKIRRGPPMAESLNNRLIEEGKPPIIDPSRTRKTGLLAEIYNQMHAEEALNIMDKYIREGLDPRWRP